MLLKRKTQNQSKRPFILLSVALGLTLFIVLLMGWNIYWENHKQKQMLLTYTTLTQAHKSTSKISKTIPQQLQLYQLDTIITTIIVILATLLIILTWYFVLRTLYKWKQELLHSSNDLEQMNKNLDRIASERTQELQNTYEQLIKTQHKKRKLSEALQQSQKLEAIGTLAAGIAHDFNNMLAIILAQTQFLRKQEPSEERQKSLQSIINVTEKASHLTQQLLTFARKTPFAAQQLDINTCVQDTVEILQPNINANIEIQMHCTNDLPNIDGDKNKIEQLLVNIGLNARDAMPKGGKLLFSTSTQTFNDVHELPSPYLELSTYVCIKIQDTGTGIEAENLKQIFDPFYTTKEVGKGTGLGLSVAYAIMQQHRGAITVHSELNKGTSFTLYFPAILV